jgi:hypothetical protein
MNLTDEQIEAAAKRIWASSDRSGYKWSEIASEAKAVYMEMARAAAPFLQVPWDKATFDEATNFIDYQISDRQRNGSNIMATLDALAIFIGNRNASLIPKPVDPRREKVINSLDAGLPRYQSWDRNAAELLTDRILAALDAKE